MPLTSTLTMEVWQFEMGHAAHMLTEADCMQQPQCRKRAVAA